METERTVSLECDCVTLQIWLNFNVLDAYILLNKTWLLPLIFRRKVRFFPFLFFPCIHLTNTRILRILKYPVLWLDLYPQQYSYCDFSKEFPYQVRACGCHFLGGRWAWHPPDGCSHAFPTPSGSTAEGLSPSRSRSHHPTRWAQRFLLSSSLFPYLHFSRTCTTQRLVCFGPQWSEDTWCLSIRKESGYSWGNKGFSSILSKQVQLALNSIRAPYAASSVIFF